MSSSRHALIGLALLGCTEPPLPPVVAPTPRVVQRPVHVMASADMSPECRSSTRRAVEYLAELGAPIDLVWVPFDHASLALEPRDQEVAVTAGLTSSSQTFADAYVWPTAAGMVARAQVVLGACTPWVVTHELAHTLGMQDEIDPEELLHGIEEFGGWGLSPRMRPVSE